MRVRKDGKVLYANEASLPLLAEWKSGIGESMPDNWLGIITKSIKSKQDRIEEFKIKGRIFSFEVAPVADTDYVNLYGRDITLLKETEEELKKYHSNLEELVEERTKELKEAEAELRLMATELNQIFNAAADAMCVIDKQFKILRINDAFRSLLGINKNEVIGKNCYELLHDSLYKIPTCPMTQILNGKEFIEYDTEIERRDGTKIPCILTVTPYIGTNGELIGIVEHFKDISDRKKIQEEIQKVDKLTAIGTFAGGIAHDFNNLLAGILGNLSLAELYIKPEHKIFEILKRAKNASLHAGQLTQQLLTFSKGGAPIKETISISELIKETTAFALRGANVKCESFLPNDLWAIDVDRSQFSQVISNLIINANQAMPEGGIVKINAENVTIGVHDSIPLKEGKYIKISVKDQGVGIPQNLFI